MSSDLTIRLQLLNTTGLINVPGFATPGAAALDLQYAGDQPLNLYPSEAPVLVGTGIAIHIGDPGYAAFILPRSGLGHRGLVLGNLVGLIDSDYQGELKVSAWNRSDDRIVINPGERFAQLVFLPVARPNIIVVPDFGTETARGTGGFGSTGLSTMGVDPHRHPVRLVSDAHTAVTSRATNPDTGDTHLTLVPVFAAPETACADSSSSSDYSSSSSSDSGSSSCGE